MRDVSRHLLAQLYSARQIGAHLIAGLRQFTKFIARTHRHLLFQIAARQRTGSRGEFARGPRRDAR